MAVARFVRFKAWQMEGVVAVLADLTNQTGVHHETVPSCL